MAEKRYNGAPFGIQTARFDVSGVHPKSKSPGAFTEIPYDKTYMHDLDIETTHCQPLYKKYPEYKRIEAIKCRGGYKWSQPRNFLQNQNKKVPNIRRPTQNMKDTQVCNEKYQETTKTANFKKYKNCSSSVNMTNSDKNIWKHINWDLLALNASGGSSIHSYTNKSMNNNKSADNNNPDEDQSRQSVTEPIVESQITINIDTLPTVVVPPGSEGGQPPPPSDIFLNERIKKFEAEVKRLSFENRLKVLADTSKNVSATGTPRRSSLDENVMSDVEKRKMPDLKVNLSRNVSEQILSFKKEKSDSLESSNTVLEIVNETQTASSTTTGTESESQRKSSLKDDTEKTSVTESVESRQTQESKRTQKSTKRETMASTSTVVSVTSGVAVGRSGSAAQSRKESSVSHKSAVVAEKVSPPPSIEHSPVGSVNLACSKSESLEESQKARDSEEDVAAADHTSQEHALAPPNSVCNTEELKEDSEQKPKLKRLLSLPNEPCDVFLKRKLGPGVYNLMLNGPVVKVLEERPPKTGWARQMELERLAALPHLLYKEQWEENKMLKRKLGPGSYNIKDFIQLSNEKPRSGRGILDNLAPRFESKLSSATPGPGTYGINGVPQKSLEIKDNKSTSTKGLLDAGDRKRSLPSVGSHLGPGTYNHKPCTEQLLNKVTSLKGPYNIFTGERDDPIVAGYLAAPKLADLGPGQYEVKSFLDDLNTVHKKGCGRFGKAPQYPEPNTDQVDFPGPGTYDPKIPKCCWCRDSTEENLLKCAKGTGNLPGFLSSAKRDDKVSQKFFIGNYNPVGAGRYDIQKFEEAADVNGHTSVFKSKTGRPNHQVAKFLQERLRGKDMCPEDKICIERVKRSITAM